MGGLSIGASNGVAAPKALKAIVPLQTGAIYTIPRLLGSTSTFALLDGTAATARGLSAGTNANLTLTGGNQISATAALAAGASQSAAVEERSADGSASVARMVTLTGAYALAIAPAAPTMALSAAAGTQVATISGVPAGQSPTISPADGRFVIGGSEGTGWKILRGLTAVSAGTVDVSVSAPGAISAAATITIATYSLPALLVAKYDGDSRTASAGGRLLSGGVTLQVTSGFGTSYNMAGLIQAVCGNRWMLREGYNHAIGSSTSLAQEERSKSTSIAATGNPAQATTGGITDNQYSTASDGVATILTQAGNHVISASVSVNDSSGSSSTPGTPAYYYNNPQVAYQTLRTIARIADAIGAAGKAWYVGNEFPRGGSLYSMESKSVSGGTCTASNVGNFVDGESFGAVGVVGVFATGSPRPLTKVASAPGQDQYTVNSSGVYVFGGNAPTTAFLTYNAYPTATGLIATTTSNKVVNEWMQSSASNFVSTVNGVDYGLPGLLYNRPWVRIADTFNALIDNSTGSSQLSLPGTMDSLQLHGTILSGYKTAMAFKAKLDADYPAAQSVDQAPTRNNWYAARGTGSGTTFSGTLPLSMRTGFTVSPAPTLVSLNGVPIGKVDTGTGTITGTGITSGSLNFSTGAWTITFASAASMASNVQLWFEQDLGNYDLTAMAEGTIGRNMLNNPLMDMTAAIGTNLTTTTGTSSITGIANASIPYGWTLGDTPTNTAVTAGTMAIAVAAETDSEGYPRFVMEVSGTATAATLPALASVAVNGVSARMAAGDLIAAGARVRYAKHSSIGRCYGNGGAKVILNQSTTGVNRNFSSGSTSITGLSTRVVDGGTGMYIDDTLLDAAGGAWSAYRVTPTVDTTGSSMGSTSLSLQGTGAANVPFAYRFGFGRAQVRRRNDVA